MERKLTLTREAWGSLGLAIEDKHGQHVITVRLLCKRRTLLGFLMYTFIFLHFLFFVSILTNSVNKRGHRPPTACGCVCLCTRARARGCTPCCRIV